MPVKTLITNQGMSLLASSSWATGQYYWLGYYALAYVPDTWKEGTQIDFPANNCGDVLSTITGEDFTPIAPTAVEPITASMTRLTTNGDMIWNVWQGDLVGTGYAFGKSDGSPGGNLFGMSLYDQSVTTQYRYVVNSLGTNTLVAWKPNFGNSFTGASVYFGTDGFVESQMPIPAPLYYFGDVLGGNTTDDYFYQFTNTEINGADIYPFVTVQVQPLIAGPSEAVMFPKISIDYRFYSDQYGNSGTLYASSGQWFNELEIPPAYTPQPPNGYQDWSWFPSETVQVPPTGSSVPPKICTAFYQVLSVSNYNRFHAPNSSTGVLLPNDIGNRNMAKTTKFFPISNYKVQSSEVATDPTSQIIEYATNLQLNLQVSVAPAALKQGYDNNGNYYPDGNGFSYSGISVGGVTDQTNTPIYESTITSIKFNRIGVYAVPLRKAPFVTLNANAVTDAPVQLQFQIDPDIEPILFCVIDFDNTVLLDSTGNGTHKFEAQVNVNLESPNGVTDTSLIRDTTVFYNLYEDDALRWYQNQLITSASTANAITELQLEVGHLMTAAELDNCCVNPGASLLDPSLLEGKGGGLKNLLDANIVNNGGLKQRFSLTEGVNLRDGDTYQLGFNAVALGQSNAAGGASSFTAGGFTNEIGIGTYSSVILGGTSNNINDGETIALIASKAINYLGSDHDSKVTVLSSNNTTVSDDVQNSVILASSNSSIKNASNCVFGGLDITSPIATTKNYRDFVFGNTITIQESSATVVFGDGHTITSGNFSSVSGQNNSVLNSSFANVTGLLNLITANSLYSSILGGTDNTISNGTSSAILASYSTSIDTNTGVSIISSYDSSINNSSVSTIEASNNIDIYESISVGVRASTSNTTIHSKINGTYLTVDSCFNVSLINAEVSSIMSSFNCSFDDVIYFNAFGCEGISIGNNSGTSNITLFNITKNIASNSFIENSIINSFTTNNIPNNTVVVPNIAILNKLMDSKGTFGTPKQVLTVNVDGKPEWVNSSAGEYVWIDMPFESRQVTYNSAYQLVFPDLQSGYIAITNNVVSYAVIGDMVYFKGGMSIALYDNNACSQGNEFNPITAFQLLGTSTALFYSPLPQWVSIGFSGTIGIPNDIKPLDNIVRAMPLPDIYNTYTHQLVIVGDNLWVIPDRQITYPLLQTPIMEIKGLSMWLSFDGLSYNKAAL